MKIKSENRLNAKMVLKDYFTKKKVITGNTMEILGCLANVFTVKPCLDHLSQVSLYIIYNISFTVNVSFRYNDTRHITEFAYDR